MIISIKIKKKLKIKIYKIFTDENLEDVIDNQMMIMNNIDIYHIKTLDHVHVRNSYEF